MAQKKKAKEQPTLESKKPLAVVPNDSDLQKAVSLTANVSKGDMANVVLINVRAELRNKQNAIQRELSEITREKFNKLIEETKAEVAKHLRSLGFTKVDEEGMNIGANWETKILTLHGNFKHDADYSKEISASDIGNKQLSIKATATVQETIKFLTIEPKEFKEMCDRRKVLMEEIDKIDTSLREINKDYIKAHITAGCLSATDKGTDAMTNLSNIAISIVNGLNANNNIPLIGLK